MAMTETKRNIFIGVLTGMLVGFVLGIVFGNQGAELETKGDNASGSITRIANVGKFSTQPEGINEKAESDTLRYEADGEDGKRIEILIISEK